MACLNSLRQRRYRLIFLFLVVSSTLYIWSRLEYRRLRSFWATHAVDEVVTQGPALTEYKTLPETKIPHGAHAPGFTMLENLYLLNGSLRVRTSEPWLFDRKMMIAQPLYWGQGYNTTPTDEELQVLDISKLNKTLPQPQHLLHIEGFTIILYDPPQFVAHMYHFIGEIVLGAWRMYSKLSEDDPQVPLPLPDKFIFPFMNDSQWKDHAGLNEPILHAAFPNIEIEDDKFWNDSIKSNVPILFDRVMLVSREAAHHSQSLSPLSAMWSKMIGGTWDVRLPDHYFEIIRQNVVRNLVGYVPKLDYNGFVVSGLNAVSPPIVTYISRQGGGRRLKAEDHERLVESLMELKRDEICKVNVVSMEDMTLSQQIETIAKSTIIVGVHGNGLTHQLWMPSGPRSTVIEIFFPQGKVPFH
ncbi:hypothetical protein C8J56DRAFT_1092988 [Mycena floridula]|nr:hypothetical protein C8J56DRAFT_1092988 [Mycena floridula]